MKNICVSIGVFASLLLVGCSTTPEQRFRQEQAQQDRAWRSQFDRQLKEEQWANDLKSQCLRYGFKPNTTEFSQCLMQVDQQKKAADSAWFAEQERQREKISQTARDLAKPPEFLKPQCPSIIYNGASRPAGC